MKRNRNNGTNQRNRRGQHIRQKQRYQYYMPKVSVAEDTVDNFKTAINKFNLDLQCRSTSEKFIQSHSRPIDLIVTTEMALLGKQGLYKYNASEQLIKYTLIPEAHNSPDRPLAPPHLHTALVTKQDPWQYNSVTQQIPLEHYRVYIRKEKFENVVIPKLSVVIEYLDDQLHDIYLESVESLDHDQYKKDIDLLVQFFK